MKRTLYGSLEVEVDDQACQDDLWLKTPRHPDTLKFLHRQLRKVNRPVLLDIGAGQGRYSLLAKFVPDMRVWSWEPNPAAFEYLVKNVQLNDLQDRVTAFPCGLWYKAGHKTLYVHPTPRRFRSATMGDHPHKKDWQRVGVEVKKLDDFQLPRVDVVKLDVEGAEWYVLQGGRKTIQKQRPALFMEYVNTHLFGYKAQNLTDLLQSWGYREFVEIGETDLWITT